MKFVKILIKCPQIILFLLYYLKEVILSNVEVAYEVLTPFPRMRPGIVAIPLDLTQETAINLLANMITMTPGTMSVDVSEDQKVLYVYGLHIKDPDIFRKNIKVKFERKVQKIFTL